MRGATAPLPQYLFTAWCLGTGTTLPYFLLSLPEETGNNYVKPQSEQLTSDVNINECSL
jgi:hypothetical protein